MARWIAVVCFLALAALQLFVALELGILPPFAIAVAAIALLIALGTAVGTTRALRWRRTGLVVGGLLALWQASRLLAPEAELLGAIGVASFALAVAGYVLAGRALATGDVRPFAVVEPGYPVHESTTGLRWQDLVVGKGPLATSGRTAVVQYTGWLDNGHKFDSSHDRGQPFSFPVGAGRVIKGWDEGVQTMRQGGHRRLIVPPSLGYGAGGSGSIPGNAILVFDVELVDVR